MSALVRIRIPACTSNMGPGFDCLGLAFKLYNTATVRWAERTNLKAASMAAAAGRAFFKAARQKPRPFEASIEGDVPASRGLGSSVTVRLGVAYGLNVLSGKPLSDDQVLRLVIELEGHPDNAVPAFFGGFVAAGETKCVRATVSPRLQCVALIPEKGLETPKARAVLPRQVTRADAVFNLQQAALITAAFCCRRYEDLPGLFEDRLHQPYRSRFLPIWKTALEAAHGAGALGCFLSGAGTTVMALGLGDAKPLVNALQKAAAKAKVAAQVKVLVPDNQGLRVLRTGR